MSDQNPAVGDQAEAEVQAGAETTGASPTEAIDEPQVAQPDGTGSELEQSLGVEGVPAELAEKEKELMRAFHEKTQSLAEQKREMEYRLRSAEEKGQVLSGLFQDPSFRKWMEDRKAERAGVAPELSDEEFQNVPTDKRAFQEAVRREAKAVAADLRRELEALRKETSGLKSETEYERNAGKFRDFDALNQGGRLDPYLQRGMSYEDAYYRYKGERGEVPQLRSQNGQPRTSPQQARQGSVNKSTAPQIKGVRSVKAKQWDDAFDKALNLLQRGETSFEIEKE